MIWHYLKIAYRNLLQYKIQSVVCMLGLAVGLACFTVCNYLLREDLAWNNRLPYFDETYILTTMGEDGRVNTNASIDLAERLKAVFPEIEKSVFYFNIWGACDKMCIVDREDGSKTCAKTFFYLADSSFFDFYDFKLTSGNWEKLKTQPDVLIMTPDGAKKVFGDSEAVGKSFTEVDDFRDREKTWIVMGMMENFPQFTDFREGTGIVLNPRDFQDEQYRGVADVRYRLQKGTSWQELNQKIGRYMEKHPELRRNKPLTVKIYPYKDYRKLIGRGNFGQETLVFAGIGFLVLLAAMFNYVLFTTGRMFNRQKELGIRQVNGSTPGAMLKMFMLEVTLTLGISFVIAAAILELVSGYFSSERSYYLIMAENESWRWLMGGYLFEYTATIWGIMLIIGYGIVRKVRRTTLLRNLQGGGIAYHTRIQTVLLGIQLAICMFLIGTVWFMQAQQQELEQRMTGQFTREEMERIYYFNLTGDNFIPIRSDFMRMLAENPYVEEWCRCGTSLLSPWSMQPGAYKIEGVEEEQKIVLQYNYVDPVYKDFVHARMEQGRFFTTNEPDAIVVNRAFANWLGQNPLGKMMWLDYYEPIEPYRIVGIMEDILPVADNPQVAPCIYMPYTDRNLNHHYYVKFKPGTEKQALQPLKAKMEAHMNSFTPLHIEDSWSGMKFYLMSITELSNLIFWLAIICVLISVLGVYSAMMLAVEKRTKEMAIRKINGAALKDIAGIFYLHYLRLLLGCALVAFPLLYWVMSQWLNDYHYRIALGVGPFVGVFVLMVVLVLLTILSQLIKIMRVNPTEALKQE